MGNVLVTRSFQSTLVNKCPSLHHNPLVCSLLPKRKRKAERLLLADLLLVMVWGSLLPPQRAVRSIHLTKDSTQLHW